VQITRERILTYLQDHPPSSAEEISRYLEMTPANIRYHLDILEEMGLVDVIGERPTGGAGRPILLYALTPRNLGENLVPLLEAFLSELNGSDSLDEALHQIAESLIEGKIGESRNRVQRFNQGIEFLNTLHYHANWEARSQGPRVELRHCPYRDLALTYPVLCQLDEKLLQLVFDSGLTLNEKRTFGKDPFSPCVFHLA